MPVPVASEGAALSRRLHADEAFDVLFRAILDGTLPPGERLRDADLESRLGVSRTPIRRAVDRLVEMRVVESRPNRYTRVCVARPALIPDLVKVMCGLWELASRLTLARLDDEGLTRCRKLLGEAAEACREHDPASAQTGHSRSAAAAVESMRRALFFFSEHSGNALLCTLVVKAGAALRFQLSLQAASLDVLLLEGVFERLDEAVAARDADATADAFRLVQANARRLCGAAA